MQSVHHRDLPRRAPVEGTEVTRFASQVVSLLAQTRPPEADAAALRQGDLNDLVGAVTGGDPRRVSHVLTALRRARVADAQIVENYIPAAARRLGADWVDDRRSFADVSIGSARLQALMRLIEGCAVADGVAPRRDNAAQTTVLIVVPAGEQHTLGASVAASRLRRAGVSVCLRIGPRGAELEHLTAARDFDAAMISVGCTQQLAPAAELVKTVRSLTARPVFVGGAVLYSREDVRACTDADDAIADPVAALGAIAPAAATPCAHERA